VGKRKRRRRNRGSFRRGPDSRRHQFTQAERRKGWERAFERALYDEPWLLLWLKRKVDATKHR
jgi:hypothetical protein